MSRWSVPWRRLRETGLLIGSSSYDDLAIRQTAAQDANENKDLWCGILGGKVAKLVATSRQADASFLILVELNSAGSASVTPDQASSL